MKNISIEFFPPKSNEFEAKLYKEVDKICDVMAPEFFSVTFGAGGSLQSRTVNTVINIQNQSKIPTAAHITCIGTSSQDIDLLLNNYKENSISRLVVLRGDLPSGAGLYHHGDFSYASDLVKYIREQHSDFFEISVAAYPESHPQCVTPDKDIQNFIKKANMGANRAITQYFYNYDAFEYFMEQVSKTNLNIPVIPGIMPITNYTGLMRFSQMCGAEIPKWVRIKLEQYQHQPEELKKFGTEVVTKLCNKLQDNHAEGLHFYCLNKAKPVLDIVKGLS